MTHPEAYENLVSEIRDTFKSANEINWNAIKDLPYLGATLRESIRLFAPVSGAMLRTVPADGSSIDGYFVAGGTTVSVAPWAATHLPLNFARPLEFLPERWLDPASFPKDNPDALQPFGIGPRGCIGKDLSYIEQRLVVAHLIWHFDMTLEGGKEANWEWNPEGDMKHMRAYITWEKPDLMVRFTSVKR